MKGLLLLSGGIDSPVAGHLVQDTGMELIAVHFSHEPFTDHGAAEKARICADKLGMKTFIEIPFGNILADIVKQCRHKYYYIISRRLMLRVSQEIAHSHGCTVIVTGESLGQVGSQTLSNMGVIDQAVSLPILRPLLGYDKCEAIALAEEIQTYAISSGPEVCSLLGPKHPATHSTVDLIEGEEAHLDIPHLIGEALRCVQRA